MLEEGKKLPIIASCLSQSSNKKRVAIDGTLDLCLKDPSGNGIGKMITNDTRYTSFDRVVVHGGYRYYVDDIKIGLLSK
jgi:hypothetical protein